MREADASMEAEAASICAGEVSAVPQETRSSEAQTRPTMSTIILDMARKILKRP
jgi:hypothetical protein